MSYFQVYIIVIIRYLYMLQNDHNGKSNYHLSPYKVIAILWTMFLTLYLTFP